MCSCLGKVSGGLYLRMINCVSKCVHLGVLRSGPVCVSVCLFGWQKIIYGRIMGSAKAQWRGSGNWPKLATDKAIAREKDLKPGLDWVLYGSEIRHNKSIYIR